MIKVNKAAVRLKGTPAELMTDLAMAAHGMTKQMTKSITKDINIARKMLIVAMATTQAGDKAVELLEESIKDIKAAEALREDEQARS